MGHVGASRPLAGTGMLPEKRRHGEAADVLATREAPQFGHLVDLIRRAYKSRV